MDNVLIQIKESYPEMNERDQHIATYILKNKNILLQYSINEIAKDCNTNHSAIVRFFQHLGFDGFKDFKKQLAHDILTENMYDAANANVYTEFLGNEPIPQIIQKVIQNNINSINDTSRILNADSVIEVAKLIHLAPKLHFYGIGSSGIVALDAERKFIRLGKDCRACTDPHMQITLSSNLSSDDVAIVISYSGVTKDILDTVSQIKKSGAHLIAITKFRNNNPLSELSEITLHISSAEWNFRGGALSSRIASLTVIDILFLSVISIDSMVYEQKLSQNFEYADSQKIPHLS